MLTRTNFDKELIFIDTYPLEVTLCNHPEVDRLVRTDPYCLTHSFFKVDTVGGKHAVSAYLPSQYKDKLLTDVLHQVRVFPFFPSHIVDWAKVLKEELKASKD